MNSDHHEISEGLSFNEKLIKILAHWEAHNTDHAKTYEMWAERAKTENLTKAGELIKEAAEMTLRINQNFIKAIEIVKNKKNIDSTLKGEKNGN